VKSTSGAVAEPRDVARELDTVPQEADVLGSKQSRDVAALGSRRLDPVFVKLLELTPPPPHLLPPIAERRAATRRLYEPLCRAAAKPPISGRLDYLVPGRLRAVRARVYTPKGPLPAPAYIYFHGGGWSTGSIADVEPHCRNVCADAGVVVVNVGYSLAPERCYPAALEDAYAVLQWVAGAGARRLGVDPDRIAVGGTSAGANLAAALCLMTRDRRGPAVDFQYLDVPPLDATMSSPSISENGKGYVLTADAVRFMYAQYLGEEGEAGDEYASPLLADDLSGLPPALIVTADCDPLRDDGIRYGERLRAAGGTAVVHNYEGMIHGFTALETLTPYARRAHEELVDALEHLHRPVAVETAVDSPIRRPGSSSRTDGEFSS